MLWEGHVAAFSKHCSDRPGLIEGEGVQAFEMASAPWNQFCSGRTSKRVWIVWAKEMFGKHVCSLLHHDTFVAVHSWWCLLFVMDCENFAQHVYTGLTAFDVPNQWMFWKALLNGFVFHVSCFVMTKEVYFSIVSEELWHQLSSGVFC